MRLFLRISDLSLLAPLASPAPASLALAAIRRALSSLRPEAPVWPPSTPSAAVSLVLAGQPDNLTLAMILRAVREGDPWSGQMALPGGRAEPGDSDPESVAERETLEEIGVSVRREQLIAPLLPQPVQRGGVDIGLQLFPFVYYAGAAFPEFRTNLEVSGAFWVPLRDLADPGRQRRYRFERSGQAYDFPAISFQERVIWGVTYRVLTEFFRNLAIELPM